MSIGSRLRMCRVMKGWSQRELSRQSGVRHPTISELESEKKFQVMTSILLRLATALEVSVEFLLDNEMKLTNIDENGTALLGYDTVSYFFVLKPIKGDKALFSIYGDAIYYFSSEKNKQYFDRDQEKFIPAFGGYCAYSMSAGAILENIDINAFTIESGRLFMFGNTRFRDRFNLSPRESIDSAEKNWPIIIANIASSRRK